MQNAFKCFDWVWESYGLPIGKNKTKPRGIEMGILVEYIGFSKRQKQGFFAHL